MADHRAKYEKVAASVAKATGIKAEDVAKVLRHLGLDKALKAAAAKMTDFEKVTERDAKIAVKVGKTLVTD